jgi:hypothetical protein
MDRLSRRSLLLAGAGVVLGACSSSSKGSSQSTAAPTGGTATSGGAAGASSAPLTTVKLGNAEYQVVQFFKSGSIPADVAHRLPFGLGSKDGVLESNGPAAMDVRVLDIDGKRDVMPPSQSVRHANGVQRPYWPVQVKLPQGTYQAQFSVGGKKVGDAAFFDVVSGGLLPRPGGKLPSVATPTPANAQGVSPLCTRNPPCDLHDVSLDEVVGKGKPVVLVVATPAYCQTAICAPMLDLVLANRKSGITYIHQEVWTSTKLETPAPLLTTYGIDYEPILFVADGNGTVTARLDVIWDLDDLHAAMATV